MSWGAGLNVPGTLYDVLYAEWLKILNAGNNCDTFISSDEPLAKGPGIFSWVV